MGGAPRGLPRRSGLRAGVHECPAQRPVRARGRGGRAGGGQAAGRATEPPGREILDLEGRWGRRGAGGTRRTRGVTQGRRPLWEGHRGLGVAVMGREGGAAEGTGRAGSARRACASRWGRPGLVPARAGLPGGGAVAAQSRPGASGLRLRSLAPGQWHREPWRGCGHPRLGGAAPPPRSRVVAAVAEEGGRSRGPRCPERRQWSHAVGNEGKYSGRLLAGTPRSTAGKENGHGPTLRAQFPRFPCPSFSCSPETNSVVRTLCSLFPRPQTCPPTQPPLPLRLLCPKQRFPSSSASLRAFWDKCER